MKCTNNIFVIFICVILLFSGCGSADYACKYSYDNNANGLNVISTEGYGRLKTFASDLAVDSSDKLIDSVDMSQAVSALLVDVDDSEVLYSKNAQKQMYPASLTKILTALVAVKYGSLNQTLTASENVNISEAGAQLCGLKTGDTMTLDQALHVLLIYSANDAAVLIAENIGGSVDNFVKMMNDEAKKLGATNSNFVNPHGLSDDNHYTTAYDLYLIFNEAVKYDEIEQIINMSSYQTTYYDAEGNAKDLSVGTTNLFLKGTYSFPNNITIIGGKTGTTNAAGHCLLLLSKDSSGKKYISIIMCSEARDILYAEMSNLLSIIDK